MSNLILSLESNTETLALEAYLERIALEGNIFSNVAVLFKETLPAFVSDIKSKLLSFKALTKDKDTKTTVELKKKLALAEKKLDSLDFLLFADRIISVPEDFNGHLPSYLNTLNNIYTGLTNIEKDVVNEYCLILAKFAMNKESQYALEDHTKFFEKVKSDRERIIGEIKVYFPKDTGKSKKRMKDVMQRWGDLNPMVTSAMNLNNLIERTNLHSITGSVQKAVDSLDIIVGQLKNSVEKVSPEAATNLARGALEVGKQIEVLSLVIFDSRVAVNCVDKILDTIIH
jgi:hypothetical protein